MGKDTPVYRRIADRIESDILDGVLKVGQKIASERVLAEKFGVSRMTARHALRHLADRGYLETRTGQGTFVGSPRIRQELSTLTGFTEEMARQGRRTSSFVLFAGIVPADRACAAALRLSSRDHVHRLVRVRLVEDTPVAHETTEIPAAVAPGLLEMADYTRESLYQVLREHYGLFPTSAEQTLAAGTADPAVAAALGIDAAVPVLKLTRLTAGRDAAPFEFVRSVYRGDSFVMNVHLAIGEPHRQ